MKSILIGILLIGIVGCSEIKPMTLPEYHPPDFSSLTRPQIDPLIEGQDYTIDEQNNRLILNISGLNKLVAKTISEQTAWQLIEMLKQTVNVQSELIKQKDQLLIAVDLQRQYSERQKTIADVKTYAAEIIGLILAGLLIAK